MNFSHGTRCAGEIAAAKDNNICGVGVAYDSMIAGETKNKKEFVQFVFFRYSNVGSTVYDRYNEKEREREPQRSYYFSSSRSH